MTKNTAEEDTPEVTVINPKPKQEPESEPDPKVEPVQGQLARLTQCVVIALSTEGI